jgi:adenine-specific DNA-methyltransferase
MQLEIEMKPEQGEDPVAYADRIGRFYANNVTTDQKKQKGQFFTPVEIADFMASQATIQKEKLNVLDPGCGVGILSCALVKYLTECLNNVSTIKLVAYETDPDILPYTNAVYNYLSKWSLQHDLEVSVSLKTSDFILENRECFSNGLGMFDIDLPTFDVIISNPPYFKIGKEDKRAIVAESIIWGQPNIYALFMYAAAKLLSDVGEMIFITPRSFTSGNYFRSFRKFFFHEIEIERIHLFGSRKEHFDRDSVLQELVILKGKKHNLNGQLPRIKLTHSNSIADLAEYAEKDYLISDLVDLHSTEKILHLPANETEEKVITLFKSWKGSLHQYKMQISTGPVVSFRATEYIHIEEPKYLPSYCPLIQLVNTAKMQFEWPVYKKGKAQYIELSEATRSILLPNKNYVFLRRFSSKDDKSRLVACPYFIDGRRFEFIGVENHLNYIYRPKGHLDRNEILGLSALLNSSLFDTYFRTFNGNINVSATELREMPMPPLEEIKNIGDQIIMANNYTDAFASTLIDEYYNLDLLIHEEESIGSEATPSRVRPTTKADK